jgi:hypothetical protein
MKNIQYTSQRNLFKIGLDPKFFPPEKLFYWIYYHEEREEREGKKSSRILPPASCPSVFRGDSATGGVLLFFDSPWSC